MPIDPLNVANYNRTDEEMEEFLLFCVMVANKNADRAAKALEFLLRQGGEENTPLETIRTMVLDGSLMTRLVQSRCGEYMRRYRTLSELSMGLAGNLRRAKPEDLEQVYGIGPKTARFFVMNTQLGAQYAAIDTHILKFLRDVGHNVGKSTPQSPKRYREVEAMFLKEARQANMTPVQFDLELWTFYSGRIAA